MSEPLNSLAVTDIVGLLLVLGLSVAGVIKGAARFVIGLVAVVAAVGLAARYGSALGADAWPLVSDATDPLRAGALVGSAVIFTGTLLAGGVLARLMRRALESASLGGLDRFLGLLLGALRGAAFTVVLVFVLKSLPVPALQADVDRSHALTLTRALAEAGQPWLPESSGSFIEGTLGATDDTPAPPPAAQDQGPK